MSSAARAVVKIDWPKLISTLGLTGSTLASLQAFKKRNDEARRHLNELSEQPVNVDFSHYRSILKNQKIVDQIESYVTNFKPSTIDVAKTIKTIEAFEAKAIENAENTVKSVELELKDLNSTLDNIKTARPFDQVTLEEVIAARPDIREKTDEMVKKGKWGVKGYDEKFGGLVIM